MFRNLKIPFCAWSFSLGLAMAQGVGGGRGAPRVATATAMATTAGQRFKVAVIGGGLAGLAAASTLAKHYGADAVVVLEAASSLGGRVKHVTGIAPWPVEVGPEFIHGTKNSSVKEIADAMGCQMRELPYPDRYYIGHEHRLLSSIEAEEHKEIQLVHELFQGIAAEDPDAPDISMAEYLCRKGATHTVIQLAQSIYANDFGCSLEQLGVRECIQEAQQWIYGDTYLILDRPLSAIIDYLTQGLKEVLLDWPVKLVEYTTDGVKLQNENGEVVMAEYAILTVPVSILQQGTVTFTPPLPQPKLRAIKSIGMSSCVKVVLAFSERFWPEDLFDVVCTDCFLPEFWITQYPPALDKANCSTLGKFTVVGFLAGELALAASKLPQAEIINRSLLQLDRIFGNQPTSFVESHSAFPPKRTSLSANGAIIADGKLQNILTPDDLSEFSHSLEQAKLRPATSSFQGGCVFDWEKETYARGGYTYPSIHAHGARAILAKPLLGRVFFAGEATHPGVNPCMQGAIDTGRRAASEVLSLETQSRL